MALAQRSSVEGPNHSTFSFAQEKQALEIICRDGYLEFMKNPCLQLDKPKERDKAVDLYGHAVGEIAGRLGMTPERSVKLIRSLSGVKMAKRFATGEFKETDCPAPDSDPPITEAEEAKGRQTICQPLKMLGNNPSSDRIAELSGESEKQFSETKCVSMPRASRMLREVRNESLAGKTLDCTK